jgi:hypothetical protein
MLRTSPYIWWFTCQTYRSYTVYTWSWPAQQITPSEKMPSFTMMWHTLCGCTVIVLCTVCVLFPTHPPLLAQTPLGAVLTQIVFSAKPLGAVLNHLVQCLNRLCSVLNHLVQCLNRLCSVLNQIYVGLARTVYLHRIWPYVWWFPC